MEHVRRFVITVGLLMPAASIADDPGVEVDVDKISEMSPAEAKSYAEQAAGQISANGERIASLKPKATGDDGVVLPCVTNGEAQNNNLLDVVQNAAGVLQGVSDGKVPASRTAPEVRKVALAVQSSDDITDGTESCVQATTGSTGSSKSNLVSKPKSEDDDTKAPVVDELDEGFDPSNVTPT